MTHFGFRPSKHGIPAVVTHQYGAVFTVPAILVCSRPLGIIDNENFDLRRVHVFNRVRMFVPDSVIRALRDDSQGAPLFTLRMAHAKPIGKTPFPTPGSISRIHFHWPLSAPRGLPIERLLFNRSYSDCSAGSTSIDSTT